MKLIVFIVSALAVIQIACGTLKTHNKVQYKPARDAGEPLYLTPFIKNGSIEEAQQLALVSAPSIFNNVLSYSGYIEVNSCTFDGPENMFFWFFPSENNTKTDPVLIWLNDGPGISSQFGLFVENGPFYVDDNGELVMRNYSWHKTHSVFYIDSPLGVGYSTTNKYLGWEEQVDVCLFESLDQLFQLFPDLRTNDIYLTGESYACKTMYTLAYSMLIFDFNIKGLAIGNGFCDPTYQLKYGDYLYQLGLIDNLERDIFHTYEKSIESYINNEQFEAAFDAYDELIKGDLTEYPTIFKNTTGFDNYYNYLHSTDNSVRLRNNYLSFIQREDVRRAIHVGNNVYADNDINVKIYLKNSIMNPVWLYAIGDFLKNDIRVLFYNGQLDIISGYPSVLNFLENYDFPSRDAYLNATRNDWLVDGEIAGYSKVAGTLTEVLVRNAGHWVPFDQPRWAFELINKFTRNIPL